MKIRILKTILGVYIILAIVLAGLNYMACPMSIDIKSKAQMGKVVTDLRCVGCGHCIDACPTQTLGYATTFLGWIHIKFD